MINNFRELQKESEVDESLPVMSENELRMVKE